MSAQMLKYRISAEQEQTTVAIRHGARIRAIGAQRPHEICLWAEVPDETQVITRTFRVVPTGGELPDEGEYLGTAFDGPYVWHVYEISSVS